CRNAYLLAIYLTTSSSPSTIPRWQFMSCCVGWTLGFLGNVYHDELLNDLRRPADKRLVSVVELTNEKEDKKVGKGRYMIPRGGLFEFVSFPNYLCEWLEWTFFALASAPLTLSLSPTQRSHLPGPTAFWPAKLLTPPWMFVIFEISAMLPRALRGHGWYHDTFGVRYPIKRRAVVPWVL
ncbi:hypothetical protein TREMEDRAFT_29078, partial [Tremella mesenterica DSM 1558]|uniref:uncharacterized protein n=1 Tax=Tremella mesenterica (strain ATCC 24925 / CBS 8224 / DSM 1558 / NBRC 9311 / NRRL Y-6157 / RJB 2259-6 / UBC 559-6) TaxID=578456 RepID=UPI0003F4918C